VRAHDVQSIDADGTVLTKVSLILTPTILENGFEVPNKPKIPKMPG
jgi:hypothetical protein